MPYCEKWKHCDDGEHSSCQHPRCLVVAGTSDTVQPPTSEAEAVLMANLGIVWLKQHAPHRLKTKEDVTNKIVESAKNSLKTLLDEAEARNYDPPVPSIVVAELEYIISTGGGNTVAEKVIDQRDILVTIAQRQA